MTDDELDNIKQQVIKQTERINMVVPYKVGDLVTLKDGNFIGAVGMVKEIQPEKGMLSVNIEMLGRMTPVMISFDKVELAS